jgi:ABC-type dipeptide/oligopeptide/nickel transport system permease subunit
MISPSYAPGTRIFRRLKRNKGAMFGIVVISLSLLTAVFAYVLAPDPTPYSNRMTVELGGEKPGFHQQFFMIPKSPKPEMASMLSRIFNGRNDTVTFLPINGYFTHRDSIYVSRYVDESLADTLRFATTQLTQPLADNFIEHTYWLGTDKYGRDILSRLLVGVRVSLAVGFVAVVISLTIGILLGSLAGYYRGWIDDVVMWLINVVWSIPTLLLVFAFTLLMGKGFWQIFIAVGLTMWVSVARLVRGQVMSVRSLEFVEAARALGFRDFRIIVKHILPNILGPVMVVAASNFASAIVIEAGLSFLGVGVQPPQPSWGLMIKENYNFIITHNPMLALAPGFAIMLLVLAFNLLGNGLRDALDVRD